MPEPIQIEVFCGGIAETNGYLLTCHKHALAFDAPEHMADWLETRCKKHRLQLHALILTHGHWDHIVDAKPIQRRLKTHVWIHQDSAPLLITPSIQAPYNPFVEIEACTPDRILDEESSETLGPFHFDWRLCPGHCPGSLCFYFPESRMLIGGDVLFAGGVGRWDLPLGSKDQLLTSIKKKLLVLPPDVRVFPGHGPSTTMGEEKDSNPYLQ